MKARISDLKIQFAHKKKATRLTVKEKLQSTPDNSNFQGKSKKGSSYREFEENSRE